MNFSKLASTAMLGAFTSTVLAQPFINLQSMYDSSIDKNDFVEKVSDTSASDLFSGLFSSIDDAFSSNYLPIACSQTINCLYGINDPIINFFLGGTLGLTVVFKNYPSILSNSYYLRRKAQGRLPNSFRDANSAFRYLVIEKGFSGLYKHSKIHFLNSYLKVGLSVMSFNLIDFFLPLKFVTVPIRFGLYIVSNFGISYLMSALQKTKNILSLKYQSGEKVIKPGKEFTSCLFLMERKQIHRGWVKNFWAKSISLAIGLTVYSLVSKQVKST